ncbi:valyl-tRNA synthetase [Tannerella sp. oral taxon BU063 isolate Cell 6/7/9]|uniref:Valine--tRNA ligase n=1 Tax=Tannerella sp. oral taxon BU063 isolate Cell 6/7/9 TaxID=1411021 RepID=W2CKV8_9BACT|nr:valyl-tRNA synthetase [Tannerella sp. oral taxon BU063 isolate Cell 6/7/9]
MALASKYDPSSVEGKWYQYWLDNGFFRSLPDEREPYTVVIPPPNVTGVLHMGHMLNNTIQDILVRRARMTGRNACWVPGTDHASIATEAKVVARLAERGIRKSDLTREEFLRHAWEWKEEHGGIILKQLRRLGASCDWDRTAFTMDDIRSRSVIRVFCDLYRKGLIYRGVRMVNWDPAALTALSDEEVIYKEQQGKLYYLRYRIVGEDGYAIVATTRPETIMGDTAMCINPNDPKNQHLRGRRVIVPLVGREIPVIEDDYVDVEFGTGCLKVTPAHDVNDYMLGEKYNLPSIDIFNDNGTIAPAGELYVGMDRFAVREQIVRDLDAAGLLEKTEDYTNKVGFSERTNVPIEPKLSMQWFLKMDGLAKPALDAVMDDEIRFYPPKFKNTYRHWMENVKDWCISRQLWWGHRIPAYYASPTDGEASGNVSPVIILVAETEEEARAQAAEHPMLKGRPFTLRQDEDCLDTWFSSWLWPIALFDGINHPGNDEMCYYYPTADLVTGPDIIFFWVARMIMAGYEYEGDKPFRSVYFTGIVRDKLGRKMSKSLGNSPDPLALIDQYGADGVRMGIMLAAPAGNDILFDESLCEQGRNFNNKIWNALRLVKSWEVSDAAEQPDAARIAIDWMKAKFCATIVELEDDFSRYRISEALMTAYKLFRDEFSAWYLEAVKPAYGRPIDTKTYRSTISLFEKLMLTLHPFMPFITEEVWQALADRQPGESIMVTQQPRPEQTNDRLTADFEVVKNIVAGVRSIRLERNIPNKESLTLQVVTGDHNEAYNPVIMKMCNVDTIVRAPKDATAASFMVGTTEYAVPLGNTIDVAEEIQKMEAEIDYLEGFLRSVMKKLGNEKFVANAKPEVVAVERKKRADAESKLALLRENVAKLKDNA